MTTASETTLRLLQDRIELLRREGDGVVDQLAHFETERDKAAERLERIVAQREALEADLAALTVADDRDDADPELNDEGLPEPVCSVCGLQVEVYKNSPTGWRHRADAYWHNHRLIVNRHGSINTWPQPVGYNVPTEEPAKIVEGDLVYVNFADNTTCQTWMGHSPHRVLSVGDEDDVVIDGGPSGPQSWKRSSLVKA